MRKSLFIPLALTVFMLTVSNPNNISAAEPMAEEAIQEQEEVAEDVPEGDGMADPITKTEKDETNTCQVSFKCDMPKGFNLGTYVQFMNTETSDVYQIIATASNDYSARMWVPAGDYAMLEIGVWDDGVGDYPMEQGEDFVLEENSNHSIISTLLNYEDVENEISRRFSAEESSTEETEEETDAEEAPAEEEMPLPSIVPWHEAVHSGDGSGIITITGNATEKISLVVQITTTGSYREGEFRYSTDGGETWSKVALINGVHEIFLTGDESGETVPTGLSINFNNADTYLVYDEYRYQSELEYALDQPTHLGKGEIRLTSGDVLYDYSQKVMIRIEKTGSLGVATFKYALKYLEDTPLLTLWSEEMVIPEDGTYQIPDNDLTLTFWDGFGDFVVGDEYVCELKTAKSKRDYTPYLLGILAIFVTAALIIVFYLLSLKEKPYEYTLNTYKKIVLPEKGGRHSSRKGRKEKSHEN